MSAFIVATEDFYGGGSQIKVFRSWENADSFAQSIAQKDTIIIESRLPADTKMAFVVVTEEWYGGGINKVRAFSVRDEAERYSREVGINGQLDTAVFEKIIE